MERIDLFIAGAQKCGTTSLKNYLGEHPQTYVQFRTEMTYFIKDAEYETGFDNAYRQYFRGEKPGDSVTVAKYVSMARSQKGLNRLFEHNPDCKIIYMVREPVQRSFSSYLMERAIDNETLDFRCAIERAMADPEHWKFKAYIGNGFYSDDIKNIIAVFGRDKLKIVVFEEFKSDPRAVLAGIFSWLNIDPEFRPNVGRIHNKGGAPRSKVLAVLIRYFTRERSPVKNVLKRILPARFASYIGYYVRQINKVDSKATLDADSRHFLSEYYREKNKELFDLLGREFW